MRTLILFLAISLVYASASISDDLFHVRIDSHDDAAKLQSQNTIPIARVADGYLVLADEDAGKRLSTAGLVTKLVAHDVDKRNLALDLSHDRSKRKSHDVLFEQGNFRLYYVPFDVAAKSAPDDQLGPILTDNLPITYSPPMQYNNKAVAGVAGLDSLINLISQDSLQSYTERLQAFYRRYGGTDSNYASSAWIKAKFESFGYDSVFFDSFTVYHPSYGLLTGRNVVATKIGASHPQWEIVVGAHHDGVSDSPAADDNGSGTAGVIEIARVLANIETDVTFRFITFDFEEWGLYGAWHYANTAAARGDHIVYMFNMDMIGYYENSGDAFVYHGDNTTFTELWVDLADSLTGITGHLNGSSGASDHHPFDQNGYTVSFIIEYEFSNVYHSPYDSTTYMSFDYMKRMVQSCLATVYTVNQLPPPVIMTSVVDAGDGQSLQLNWEPMSPDIVDHIRIYYRPEGSSPVDSTIVAGTESSTMITGLTEGQSYEIWAMPFDAQGQSAAEYEMVTGTPYSVPAKITQIDAMPIQYGIKISWPANSELDMSHYRVVRGYTLLPDEITDTFFVDYGPDLGKNLHQYIVRAVDFDGHMSDTVGVARPASKAAWFDPGRILAVNRSNWQSSAYLVDAAETGNFLHQALSGFDYDYLSDTAHTDEFDSSQFSLYDLIDYELVVIGAESAGLDDLGLTAANGGRLDTLAYYLSIGGKVIVFGRWGELDFTYDLTYDTGSSAFAYTEHFDIGTRHMALTESSGSLLLSDLVGAHGQQSGYPDLTWDSNLTVQHTQPTYTDVTGIPCVSFVSLNDPGLEVLYTYNSSDDGAGENYPVAWRDPGRYVYFELPLSFIERSAARLALTQAILDFGFMPATSMVIPDYASIWADPGDAVAVYLGNLVGGHTPADIDQSTVRINDSLVPDSFAIVSGAPYFADEVLAAYVSSTTLAESYGELMCAGNEVSYAILWQYIDEPGPIEIGGLLVVNGYKGGDANTDGEINIADAVYLINFIFNGGPAAYPAAAGDANSDGGTSIGDPVYIVNYVFKGGPPPPCQ